MRLRILAMKRARDRNASVAPPASGCLLALRRAVPRFYDPKPQQDFVRTSIRGTRNHRTRTLPEFAVWLTPDANWRQRYRDGRRSRTRYWTY